MSKLYFRYGAMSSGKSAQSLQIAHSKEEIKTVCHCGKKAIFNIRKINNEPVFTGEQQIIDDNDNITYEAVCRTTSMSQRKGKEDR